MRTIFVYEPECKFPARMYGNGAAVLQVEINESLETLLKNDCRLVSKKTGDVNQTYVDECFRQLREKTSGLTRSATVHNIIETLEKLWKSDSRPVLKTDLPKPSEPEETEQLRELPKTLQELGNLLNWPDKRHLEKAVGQLLVSGCVTNAQCRLLLRRLEQLGQKSCMFHLTIQHIQERTPGR